jgi:hypothetical protein
MHEPLVRLMGSDPGPVQLAYLAWNDQCGGNAESAGERIVRAQQMAKARGHDPTLVVVQLVAFWILYAQQRFDRLREEIDLLIDRAREGQYAMWRAVGTLGDGTERACNGGVGIERIREGLAAYRATGAQFASEHIGTWEVDALLTAGEPEAALARASELLESECGSRPQVFRPELRRQRAEALIALSAQAAGDERMRLAEQARDQLERAVDDARGLGVRWVRLRAATRLARLELEDGRPERASALVEEALDGIVGPADLADIAAAQRLRREIGRPT